MTECHEECRHYLGIVRREVMLSHRPELDNGPVLHQGAGLTQTARLIGLSLGINKVMTILILFLMAVFRFSKLPRPEQILNSSNMQ